MSDTLEAAAKRLVIQAMQLKDFGHEGTGGEFWTNASKTALLEECAEKAARAVLDLVTPVDRPEAPPRVLDDSGLHGWAQQRQDFLNEHGETFTNELGNKIRLVAWRSAKDPMAIRYILKGPTSHTTQQMTPMEAERLVAQLQSALGHVALVTPVDHPEAVGVKIKPLEWNEDGWLDGRAVKWLAVSFGYSWIIRNDDHAFLCCGCRYASLDRAKAAAQADFETRIRSAIQPSDEAGVAWGDSGPIPGQSFGDEFDAQPQPVAPLRLHFDRETLKRKIEADGEEGEIGAGYEMFAAPATEHALSKDTSRFKALSSVDDETLPANADPRRW
ncbi:hypothetical protein [Mesorhizobium sp. M0843]|uniref:hypothetical protein n=1 Tax=Mesorhizobium sp. M0843 TaxID=2957010 RepID=UPI0033351D5D